MQCLSKRMCNMQTYIDGKYYGGSGKGISIQPCFLYSDEFSNKSEFDTHKIKILKILKKS
jgi:hypothetical protein